MADGSEFGDVVFQANGNKLTASVSVGGEYDPGDLVDIDRAIRHMPAVVAYLQRKAEECRGLIEKPDDFRVILSTGGESRARAYVAPANDAGVHLEAADGVLLKAAIAMQGK